MPRKKSVELGEQETIINFNKAEPLASIFTYEETWQQHLEKNLGLKPVMVNGYGGREYEIDKRRIRPPRAPLKLSPAQRQKLAERAKRIPRQKSPNLVPEMKRAVASPPRRVKGVSNP